MHQMTLSELDHSAARAEAASLAGSCLMLALRFRSSVCLWPIASFRRAADLSRYRSIADIEHDIRPLKLQPRIFPHQISSTSTVARSPHKPTCPVGPCAERVAVVAACVLLTHIALISISDFDFIFAVCLRAGASLSPTTDGGSVTRLSSGTASYTAAVEQRHGWRAIVRVADARQRSEPTRMVCHRRQRRASPRRAARQAHRHQASAIRRRAPPTMDARREASHRVDLDLRPRPPASTSASPSRQRHDGRQAARHDQQPGGDDVTGSAWCRFWDNMASVSAPG